MAGLIPIHFSHPQYLLLLPVIWGFTWWVLRGSLAELGRARGRLSAWLRVALLTLLVLALSGVQFIHPTNSLCTVFAVDVSDSISPNQRAVVLDYIKRAEAKKHSEDQAALVAFGADALLDHAAEDKAAIAGIHAIPITSRTDISAAIQLAMAEFPQDSGKQIVLFSDGNENLGNALEQAALAQSSDVRISTVPLERDFSKGESLLLRADAPSEVKQGAPFQVSVVAQATNDSDGLITLYKGKEKLEERAVHLKPGKQVIPFEESVTANGTAHYHAVLDVPSSEDTLPDNNLADAYVNVSGKPRVLIVEGQPGDGAQLAKALRANDLIVELGGPDQIPTGLAECAQYDSIVFANVPAWNMSPTQMALLHSAVQDTGMGFAMVGGEESFGAGGYLGTPVEDALPVSMDVKKKKRYTAVAVAMVIESLEEQVLIDRGVEAGKVALDGLTSTDQFGVIGCDWSGWGPDGPSSDSSNHWSVPLQYVTNKDAIKSQMDALKDLGDPGSYDEFLLEAAEGLKGTGAKSKHIILVGDGDATADQKTLTKIHNMGITLSAISTGIDGKFGMDTMKYLAYYGGGRAYEAKRPDDLPNLLLRDEQSVSRPPLNENAFHVRVDDDTHPVSKRFPGAVPRVCGATWSPRINRRWARRCCLPRRKTTRFLPPGSSGWGTRWPLRRMPPRTGVRNG